MAWQVRSHVVAHFTDLYRVMVFFVDSGCTWPWCCRAVVYAYRRPALDGSAAKAVESELNARLLARLELELAAPAGF